MELKVYGDNPYLKKISLVFQSCLHDVEASSICTGLNIISIFYLIF